MTLLLDVGNTRLKWAWLRGDEVSPGGAVVHAGSSPQFALESIRLSAVPEAIAAATVAGGAMRDAVDAWGRQSCGLGVRWVSSTASACGVRNAYSRPERLGVDRWLAVIAASHRAKGAAMVVDAGTAVTIDVVDAAGQHLGGLIAPGVHTQRRALRGDTQLKPEDAAGALRYLAVDTDEAVAWGTLHSVLGMIERIHGGVARDLVPLRGYLTGGEAPLLADSLIGDWTIAPDLVLEGLARILNDGR